MIVLLIKITKKIKQLPNFIIKIIVNNSSSKNNLKEFKFLCLKLLKIKNKIQNKMITVIKI